MDHVRGAPYHSQTQGKIERWHQILKNRVLLENYFLPGDLKMQIGDFIDHYNNHRYHMRVSTISRPQIPTSGVMLRYRKEEKDQETDHPKTPLEPSTQSGLTSNQDEPDPLLQNKLGRPKCFDDGH